MGISTIKLKESKIVSSMLSVLRETLMIIIGIFLALQIDSWVGQRADTNHLKSNLNYVIENLNNNKAELIKIKELKESSIQSCTKLIDSHKLLKSMSPDEIVKTLSSILITNKFINEHSGFDRIKSSPLYESNVFFPVRDKIRAYNDILIDLRFTENFINSYISSLSLEMSKKGKLLCIFDYLRIKKGIAHYKSELPYFKIEDILSDNKPLQAVLYKYEYDAQSLIKNYTKLLVTGEELIDTIEKYNKRP